MTRRDVGKGALGTSVVALAGAFGTVAAAQARAARDPLWFVHPELRPGARQIQEMVKTFPAFSDATLAVARKGMAGFSPKPSDAVPYVRRTIPGAPGTPEVAVYVVNAKPGARRAGILHTHGGGYVVGTAEGTIPDLQKVAAALDCAIVSVDYRLAPETRWPGSLEDNYAGLHWLHRNAAALGVDPARVAVMGESAGGGHAALLAIAARDRGEVPLAFQCLVYPMLDDRTGSTRAVPAHVGSLGWTAESNRYGWRSFLGRAPGGAAVQGVPGRTANLAGLPPAWIGVGSIDLFVEEDIAYAQRLIAAGVMTELLVVPGAFHGFDNIGTETSLARGFTAAKIEALRRGLAG